uniref:60S ribosomal protein L6 n=1 Tax=Chloropicon laureae TaxID=464258 RepID=A0A7S2Z948_9CHLO|mmetsp:Transcript_9997/g.25711  ORF Transcript_9997/g.25711 Transcript_9997/m.25711 type:complete len:198 (+) Transcript_9997:84-677(+)|eukprot:CAMPEP_0197492864 /NCGR_PEP_ID=MMETSP1311-20131121/16420_1 /TAXON_ID=464262 /ORGANISM="Genus nov. species nov., Strain RCC856" /LENGTH=197 /DNA_ID=CAMNT_0043037991 /DNA_START=24 /DNA_END=617 /DNA_ORIENTATION=+
MTRTGVWKKEGGAFKKVLAVAKPSKGKSPRFYAPEDVKKPLAKKATNGPTKLRASITPGTVLILLAGHFKGKRVIFLKQLPSGLLLVTGPYAVNGVPMRRVNQAYVIATETKVDVSSVNVSKYDDSYFKGAKKEKKSGDSMFKDEATKKELSADYLANQKAIDSALKPIIAKTKDLEAYLKAHFSLKDGDRPHLMKF